MKLISIAFLALTALAVEAADDGILRAFLDAEPIHPTVRIASETLPYPTGHIVTNEEFHGKFRPFEGCSLNVSSLKASDYGNITSPLYPLDYPASQDCLWSIESEPGTKIVATFFDFVTQPWFFIYFDSVVVSKDGQFSKVDTMAGDLNDRTPFTVTSDKNKLAVRFESSQYSNYRGFKLEYIVTPDEDFVTPTVYDGVCGESYTLEEGWAPTTTAAPEESTETPTNSSRIIGENPAFPHQYPWMVALLINNRSFCGGSVIDSRHILTAAHCTDGAEQITILLGSHNIKKPSSDPGEQSRKIVSITAENIFQHPNYDGEEISHDISILRLPQEHELDFTKENNIRPICLPSRYMMKDANVGETVQVSGWGIKSDDSKGVSPELQHTKPTTVMSNANCRQMFRDLISGNQICMNTTPTNSACKGDSGGPLFTILKDEGRKKSYIVQYGIVSFGSFSCERGFPVAFTRVTAFLDYIEQITGRKSN